MHLSRKKKSYVGIDVARDGGHGHIVVSRHNY